MLIEKDLLQPYIEKLKTLMPGAVPPGGAPVPGVGGGGGPISSSGTCVGPALETVESDKEQFDGTGITRIHYEVTWCGTISDQGEDLTFKMYGPRHSADGDCSWCVMHVKKAGKMVAGGEGPHPHSNCEHPRGGGGEAVPCYKATKQLDPYRKVTLWLGGFGRKWLHTKVLVDADKKSSTKTGNTLMVRNDGPITTKCAS